MKFKKIFLLSALMLMLGACEEPAPTIADDDKEEPEQPVVPDDPAVEDVVSPKPTFGLMTQAMTADTKVTYQEMEGFGASDCWLPNWIGQYWSTNRDRIAQWLFSQEISGGNAAGIGLSQWRVNLGAGTHEIGEASGINADNAPNRAECFMNANGSYNWSKCAGQQFFMQKARDYGVQQFVLFSNSPLVYFTKNGQGRSDSGSKANLKDDCYTAFAEYMAEVAKHFIDNGYGITHISPVNEPQYNWNDHAQEGSGWQNTEVARLARELDKSLNSRNLATKISLGESSAWDVTYSGSNDRKNTIYSFFDPASKAYVGDLKSLDRHIAGHSYWTDKDGWEKTRSIRSNVASAAKNYNLRVWQTEWSMLDREPVDLGGSYDAVSEFDIAQFMSRVIHNDITMAGCSSWSYWTSMSVERWSQKNRFELIKTTPSGGNYSNDFTVGGTATPTDNLWVLGNYSRFVRPGYKRCRLDHEETANFFGTAYVSPDGKTLVVVVTNYDKTKGATLDMAAPEGTKKVTRYTTTADKHLRQDRFNPADKVFVDPASVTTVVYEL